MREGAQPASITQSTRSGRPVWLLHTAHAAMVLSLAQSGLLLLEYWGPRCGMDPGEDSGSSALEDLYPLLAWPSMDGLPLAYPVYGDPTFQEPCLGAVYADGVRLVRLVFESAAVEQVDGRTCLELRFVDPAYSLAVTHRFIVFEEHDVVCRSARLENGGALPVRVERALSAGLTFPPARYDLWTLHGQFFHEFQLRRQALVGGKYLVESRRGFTSHEASPWFALTPAGGHETQRGPVWLAALAWSGNWAVTFEVEGNDTLSVVAGINPFDFAWHLAPGEVFETPSLACGYTQDGLGGAARLLHRYQAAVALPAANRDKPRPVLFNSWEATGFDVRVEEQKEFARRVADLGVELFVVDDGWFGQRDSDRAGLGDWIVNPRKFPHGLGELVDEVHRLGMAFGLWVEPEMVNPDSDLYRAHPDWVLHFPQRERTLWRNQLVLNFARDDVRQNVGGQLSQLLRENPIDFLKWDHNRPLTEAGWPEAASERQREVWVRHTRGVYEVLAALRTEHPNLLLESCASGGGRVDLGILRYADQVWTSDNTEASDRLAIQYGYSRAYAPRTMACWVTDSPSGWSGRTSSLEFRFHVGMQGVLGIGGNVLRWTAEETAQARELVALYRRVRPVIQLGTQHWLLPPSPEGPCAVQYVSDDQRRIVLFLYQIRGLTVAGPRSVCLRGLDQRLRYRREQDGVVSTGALLMGAGVPILLSRFGALDCRSEVQVWEAAD